MRAFFYVALEFPCFTLPLTGTELPNTTPGPAGYLPTQYDKNRNPCAIVIPKREQDPGKTYVASM